MKALKRPGTAATRILTLPWEFLGPLLAIIAIQLPFFSCTFWVDRDTVYIFHFFYSLYTDLFFHGEFAHWLPFATYGLQSDFFQLHHLSAFQYLAGFLGACLRVRNADFLFKASVLLEHCLLLYGTWRLSGKFLKSKAAVFFVCFGVVASVLWLPQINWNFRIYYALPLVFDRILVFFTGRRGRDLWLAGIVFILVQPGLPSYFVAYYALIALFFFVFAAREYGMPWRGLFERSRSNALFFSIFLFLSAAYVYYLLHMLDGMVCQLGGRESNSHVVDIDNFLSLQGITTRKFLEFLFPNYFDQNTTLYIGILPLIFALYGTLRCRRPFYGAFAWLTLFALCLTVSETTFLARAVYDFFPPIRLFHHFVNTASGLKLFFMILAGFGLDQFLADTAAKTRKPSAFPKRHVIYACGLVLGMMLLAKIVNLRGKFFADPWPVFSWSAWLASLFVCFYMCRKNVSPRRAVLIILAVFAADLFAYQALFGLTYPNRIAFCKPPVVSVHPFDYQETRGFSKNLNPRMAAAAKVVEKIPFRLSAEAYQFLLYDIGIPREYPNYYSSRGVHELLTERFPQFYYESSATAFMKNPDTAVFFGVFGISIPKLRFAPAVFFAADHAEAKKICSDRRVPIDKLIVLEDIPLAGRQTQGGGDSKLRVTGYSFNHISLETIVGETNGAWLYYADAYHPGWKAFVDGEETPVYRANLAFKAIRVDAGRHQVKFEYSNGLQNMISNGMAVSGILFAAGFLAVMGKDLLKAKS
jgi:hypothetical protein